VAKREIDRRELGLFVGYGKAGPYVRQVYQVYFSDGTDKVEKGHAIFAWAGMRELNPHLVPKKEKALQKLLYRPDLDITLRMVHEAWDTLSGACWRADNPEEKPHGRSTKSNRRKGARR
jgi:hypothetical protein